jgi:nicotinate dehydrogenase subunit B
MNDHAVPTQAELLARDGVLLVVAEIHPPPGLVPDGKPSVIRSKELVLFVALCGSGEYYAPIGHVDLDTGIQTPLGQIAADELGLRIDQISMVIDDTTRPPSQGATIGNASLVISEVHMRLAAVEARGWLLAAAAERFGTADLRVEGGVVHCPKGQALSFGELIQGQRIELTISGDALLKQPSGYKEVAPSLQCVDTSAKATDDLTFVHDMGAPDMLHGRVVRPPYDGYATGVFVGTSLVSVDESSIAHLPGRARVVVIGDFVGVVAEREELAIKAALELKVIWKPWQHHLPNLDDSEHALRDKSSTQRVVHDTGGVDAALARVHTRLTRSYLWPYHMHASIDPAWAVADVQPAGIRVWSGTQNPHALRADLAWLLECDEAGIEIIRTEAASSYGSNCADDVCADAVLLSRAVGKPVRVQLTSEQEHAWGPKGTVQSIDVDGGIDALGDLAVYDFRTRYPSNGLPTLALLLTGRVEPVSVAFDVGDRTAVPHYCYPEVRVSIEDIGATVRASWLRGVSAMPNVFAHESYIDELAHEAGVDPVEYRLRYLPDERAAELVRATAERAQWTSHTQPRQTPGEEGVLRGRGFAYARYIHSKSNGYSAAGAAWVADVAIDKFTGDVAVTRMVVGHDAAIMVNSPAAQHLIPGNVTQPTSRVLKDQVTFEESRVAIKDWGGYPILTFPKPQGIEVMMPLQSEPPLDAGEPASVPSAAAIANAVFDATGIRFRELPITAERVLAALKAAEPQDPMGLPYAAPVTIKKRKWLFGGLAGLFGTALGLGISAMPWRAEIAPVTPPPAGTWSEATLERGRQLVAAGDCAVCHTAPHGVTNAGGLAMDTPFGTLYSTNITPDGHTGIGNWSFAAFDRAMRQGISRDGRHLYPAFPYTAFRNIKEADMQALYAYLMSQPAVSSMPPANQMRFPFNVRALMAGWNTLFLKQGEFQDDPTRSAQWNRGNYLVNGLGHCAACHSPRNVWGAEQGGAKFLSGAIVDGWEAPALTGLSRAPVPWTEEQLFAYMRTGFSAEHGVAAGPMGPVVSELSRLPDYDLQSIAHYIASLAREPAAQAEKASASLPMPVTANLANGRRVFEGACAGCHSAMNGGPKLFGVSPSMTANTNVHSDRPDNLIKVILQGIGSPAVNDLGYMPGFKDSLSDTQISDLVAYLRSSFAGDKVPWPPLGKQVAWLRANPGSH